MPDIVEIPASLRRITVGREGSAGEAWLGSLPGLIDELLQRWDCVPAGSPVSGKVGIIVPATSPVYGDVVLKVSFPHPANVHEPDAYATWNGRGAVAMCARDDASFAMLLERIDSVRPVEAVLVDGQITAAVVDAAIGIAGALARTLAVPAPAHLPRVAEQAAEWADTIERAAGRVSENAVAMANETLRDLCLTQPETMVHGDLHFNNILRGVREPWQVIDPKGCAGDPAYDVITLLRTTAMYLLGGEDLESALDRWIGIFADAAGLDRGHVQRWAQVRAVVVAQRSLENDRKPQWVRDINIRLVELLT